MSIVESQGLRHYLFLVWKWLWLFILIAILSGGVAFTASRMTIPIYQAKTTLLINEQPTTGVSDYTAILLSQLQATTYSNMLTNRVLMQKVITDLGLKTSANSLAASITVDVVANTRLITVTVENSDPTLAANIANALAVQFNDQLHSLENTTYSVTISDLTNQMAIIDQQIQSTAASLAALGTDDKSATGDTLRTTLAQYRQTYANLVLKLEDARLAEASTGSSVIQLEPAVPNRNPIRPRVLVTTLLAIFAGLVLAGGAVIVVESLDDTIHTPEDVKKHFGLPIYGVIPSYSVETDKPITQVEPRSPVSDAYRALRTNIHFASVDRPIKKLLITSSIPGEGKSTVTANLGVVMAQSDMQTTIVDSDFYRPTVHKLFGLDNRTGLSDLLAEKQMNINRNVQKLELSGLGLLSTGKLPPNPSELLGSEKMAQIIQLLSEQVDLVLIDSSPVVVVSDSMVIASRVDGVLLVIKPGVTRIASARQAIEQLRRANGNVLGVILNNVNVKRDGYYTYNSYQYHYGEDKIAKNSPVAWIKRILKRKKK